MRMRIPNWRAWSVAVLAVIASATGLVNQFTYDDRYIVQLNTLVNAKGGWWRVFANSYWPKEWGGDGYRPLTIFAFKLQWAIGHGSPVVFHAANTLLYALCAVLVFVLARRLLPTTIAWVVAALFAVDPVHVEAVANVVGQSELIVGAALLTAMLLYLGDRMHGGPLRPRTAAAVFGLYVVACFSKEHGVVLPALLGALEVLIVADPAPWRDRLRHLRPSYLLLVAAAVAFIGIRSVVLADHGLDGFQPFVAFATLHISPVQRILTAFGVVPQWIRLLFWPARLSSDYGPPDIQIAQGGFGLWQVPGMLLLVGIVALGFALARRRPVISLGIAITAITLLPSSNFIVPAGIVLAERTLFLPSVGAALIVGGVAAWVASLQWEPRRPTWLSPVAATVTALLVLAGAYRSMTRAMVWKDNATLVVQAVQDSPRSYRAHFMYGAWLFEQHQPKRGEAEYLEAFHEFPFDPGMAYSLAMEYYRAEMWGPALSYFRWLRAQAPNYPGGHTAYATCLLETGHYAEAKAEALKTMRYGRALPILRRLVALADSAQAADSLGKGVVPHSVTLAGHTGRSPETVQNTGATGVSRKQSHGGK